MAVLLTLTVLPAVLVALDKWVVYGKQNRYTGEDLNAEGNKRSEGALTAKQ
jgi:hypothetical protein